MATYRGRCKGSPSSDRSRRRCSMPILVEPLLLRKRRPGRRRVAADDWTSFHFFAVCEAHRHLVRSGGQSSAAWAPAAPGPAGRGRSFLTVSAQRIPSHPSFKSTGRIPERRDRGRRYSDGEASRQKSQRQQLSSRYWYSSIELVGKVRPVWAADHVFASAVVNVPHSGHRPGLARRS